MTSGNKQNIWHSNTIDHVTTELGSDRDSGLGEEKASKRLDEFGFNEIEEKKGRSPFKIFLLQFNDFMIWILIAAAFVSGIIIREITDAVVIVIILIINSIMGFIQEYRAEKALAALKELACPKAIVIRDGKEKTITSRLLVPGDLIKLSIGDLVPADCRVIKQTNLQANESILTGESLPVEKTEEVLEKQKVPLGDRKNMLYSGTTITRGRCMAIVVATGKDTEIGKIASMVAEAEEKTPLQIELRTVGKKIGIICLVVSAIVFGAGILKGNSVAEMLLVAVALAVASIPEGLPAIVTISLALGVQRMAKNNAIVRKLSSVETLGSVTVICTDKTGTLTQNKMVVRRIISGAKELKSFNEGSHKDLAKALEADPSLRLMLKNALLCNDAYFQQSGQDTVIGDPTEGALLETGKLFSLTKEELEETMPRVMEEPFDSVRKMMSTVNEVKENGSVGLDGNRHKYILFCKGAPEVILKRCNRIIEEGDIKQFLDKEKIYDINRHLANEAMRNLAFSFKYLDSLPETKDLQKHEEDMVFLGIMGMIDPPRPEVYEAISKAKMANIKVIMVTGDHKLTATAIGKELKILNSQQDKILEGQELDSLTPGELEEQIEDIRIFARVSPTNKVQIVEALKKKSHIVAMTGDGINDAPSLKKADIGLAMGITGTDVSKEASEMILTDDNFATIVKAIKEGRVIYDNLKKFILFLLSCNISEVLLMFIAIIAGDYIFYLLLGECGFLYIPLLPVQILWMNLITDGLPAMALGIDPPEANIMDRKASKSKEHILGKKGLATIGWQGLVLTFGALFVYFIGPMIFEHSLEHDIQMFQTSVFTTLVLTQLLHTFNFRFAEKGIFRKGIFANKYLNIAILVSLLLQLAIIYLPFLQNIFDTAALDLDHWLIILVSSVISVLIINFINELLYKIKRNRSKA